MTIKEEIKYYAKKINSGELPFRYLLGAFGDIEECTGLVVEDIFPKEGGAYNKLLGCSYLLKCCPFGMIPIALIELYGLAKKMVSKIIIDIQKDKLLLSIVLLFYIFRRKKFYSYFNEYIFILYQKTIGVLPPDHTRFNNFQKELRRVNNKVFENEKHPLAKSLKKLFEVVVYLMDFDTAYRFPAQDVLENINKKNPPRKEFIRLCEILEKRFTNDDLKEKSRQLKKINLLFYHPFFKRILTKFLQEINIDKVKLDEADWYFCLKRKLYNFRGVSLEERIKEAQRIDKEKGHIKVHFKETNEKDFEKVVQKIR